MSWQDFVSREGAVVDSLLQLPLNPLVLVAESFKETVPDVTMSEVPPSNGLGVIDRHDLPNNFVFQQELPEKHIVRTIPQNMPN